MNVQEQLDKFDAERAERDAEAFRLAEIWRLIADTADACADGVEDATKVLDLGNLKQPQGEETSVAWDDLLETVVDWLGDDAAKARPEFVRRMENLIEAVRMDAYSRCLNNVDVLKGKEGVGNL